MKVTRIRHISEIGREEPIGSAIEKSASAPSVYATPQVAQQMEADTSDVHFLFITTGGVAIGASAGIDRITTWGDLDAFTQDYIEALFSSMDMQETRGRFGELKHYASLPHHPDSPAWWGKRTIGLAFHDLAPKTLGRIIADCKTAQTLRGSDGYQATGSEFWKVSQSGLLASFPPRIVQLSADGKVEFAS